MADSQTAGSVPVVPTATNPADVAVTPFIIAVPPPDVPCWLIVARCQPVRPGEYQAVAAVVPEWPTDWRPTITYAAGPAATAVAVYPAPDPAMPLVTVHVLPVAEEATSGPPVPAIVVPTAS